MRRSWYCWVHLVRLLRVDTLTREHLQAEQAKSQRPIIRVDTLEQQERDEMNTKLEEMRVHYEALLRDQDSVLLEQDALFHLRVMEELQQKVPNSIK